MKPIIGRMTDNTPTNAIANLYYRVLHQFTIGLVSFFIKLGSPARSLKFLLRLDSALYKLQGQLSIVYGNGIHPKHHLMNYHDFFVSRISGNDHVMDIGRGIDAVAYDVAQVAA